MNNKKTEGNELAIIAIGKSQLIAAKVAGIAFLLAMVIVVIANYGINFRLIIPGNAVDTARNILANETLFRINIACNLIYVINIIVLLSALHVVLKHVNQNLSMVAAFFRLMLALMWVITSLNSLSALRFYGNTAYLSVFNTEQLQTLARINLSTGWDAYYVGLPFWTLASTVCAYLFFRSRYIPKVLAIFGIISSAWCVFCAFTFIIFPHFDAIVSAGWFDMPVVIFELILGFWLLIKGIRIPDTAISNQTEEKVQS